MKLLSVETLLKAQKTFSKIKRYCFLDWEQEENALIYSSVLDTIRWSIKGPSPIGLQLRNQFKTCFIVEKKRRQVELLNKWIKQLLHIKSFWGVSENADRIQIHSPIITYCLAAIVEHDIRFNRSTFEHNGFRACLLLVKLKSEDSSNKSNKLVICGEGSRRIML